MEIVDLQEIQEKIESLAHRVLGAHGVDLLDLKVSGHKNDLMLSLTADKPSGGISIAECAIINKSLRAAIEQDNYLPPEVFSLEISSPGLDRPLSTRKDFMRVIGQPLHFWLNTAVNGKKECEAIVLEAGDSSLLIEVAGKKKIGTAKIVLPLSSIIKGELVI